MYNIAINQTTVTGYISLAAVIFLLYQQTYGCDVTRLIVSLYRTEKAVVVRVNTFFYKISIVYVQGKRK